MRKTRFAVRADGHDAARHPHGNLARGKLFRRKRGVFRHDLRNRVRDVVLARVSLIAQVDDRLEFLLALLDQIGMFIFGHGDYLQSAESFDARIKRAL